MKTKNQKLAIALTALIMFMLTAITTQSQIHFKGFYSNGEGLVSWNADGSGPEPAATGHSIQLPGCENQGYYLASRDYLAPVLTPSTAGFHFTGAISGFPLFSQVLEDYGISVNQISVSIGLSTLGNDVEGEDWFVLSEKHYANYYNLKYVFKINGKPMIGGSVDYVNIKKSCNMLSLFAEYSFTKPFDKSSSSPVAVQKAAKAFLEDLGGEEMHLTHLMTKAGNLTGHGRIGEYYNVINGTLQKGLPQIQIQGLAANHEGYAVWNADGSGPEPLKTGHLNTPYFRASRDYDGLDQNPQAALFSFLDEAKGFTNFYLQMAYLGIKPSQVKTKASIEDLDEDIEGEDWSILNGVHRLNYYHSSAVIEVDGEPLLGYMEDTTKFLCKDGLLMAKSSACIVYDAVEDESFKLKLLARTFLKELGDRQLQIEITGQKVPGIFIGNGRTGSFCEITSGILTAKRGSCTKINQEEVYGNWTTAKGPYIITNDITIPNGKTLKIEPGVWLKIMDGHTIDVQGQLLAVGDESNKGEIVFTAVNSNIGWGGLRFDNTSKSNDSSMFKYCIFENGNASGQEPYNSGGAIAAKNYGKIVIDNCLFQNNTALKSGITYPPSGGAVALWGSSPKITNSVFVNNKAAYGGGIMLYNGSNALISNCLFYDNESVSYGGAIEIHSNCKPVLLNNTITENRSEYGGGIDVCFNSMPTIINTIITGNSAKQWRQISITSGNCKVSTTYSDIEKGLSDIGPYPYQGLYLHNISANPLFLNTSAKNFTLTQNSPCVNTGTTAIVDPNGSTSDMGAFYFAAPASPAARIATEITYNSFVANWLPAFDAQSYRLYVAYDEEFKDYVEGYNGLDVGDNTTYMVTDLKDNTMYYYRLTAVNDIGYSEYSDIVSLKTLLPSVEKSGNSEVVLSQMTDGLILNVPAEIQTGGEVYVYNVAGQLLSHQIIKSGTNNISLNEKKQILIIKVVFNDKCITKKIFRM